MSLNPFPSDDMTSAGTGHHAEAIAFEGTRRVAIGELAEVARVVRTAMDNPQHGTLLVLDTSSSAIIDLDLRGTPEQVAARYKQSESAQKSASSDQKDDINEASEKNLSDRGPGRPRLGVVPREVTLLPRHWDWLASQPGGASATLRKLVEYARALSVEQDRQRGATESVYRFLTHLAGNEPGFEEASRALFAGEQDRFLERIAMWPEDVRAHAEWLLTHALHPDPNQSA
jgi:hypothetical protein